MEDFAMIVIKMLTAAISSFFFFFFFTRKILQINDVTEKNQQIREWINHQNNKMLIK